MAPGAEADPERLAALDRYGILDTPPEQGYDDIVQLAAQICRTPVALVSLVAADRQWFKAQIGAPSTETDLDRSVCRHGLAQPGLLIIPDLTVDARTRDNPLVTAEPSIRFYAGAPLRTSEGATLGMLCVIDLQPRPEGLTPEQGEALQALARQVMTQLELRRALQDRTRRATRLEAEITGRADADTAQREMADRLRLVQQAGGIGSFDWDIAAGVVHRSPEYLSIQGLPPDYPLDEAYGDGWADRLHPDDREHVVDSLGDVLARGGSYELEYRIIRPVDGRTAWLLNRGRVDLDVEGNAARLISAQSDITARKSVEAALRESEERLRLAQEAAGLGSFDWNLRTQRAELSDTYLALLGFASAEEVTTESLIAQAHPDDRDRLAAELHAIDSGRDTPVSVTRVILPDGSMRWVQSTARTQFDAAGRAVRRTGVLQDVTVQRAAEAALRESEERLRLAVENAEIGFWDVDVVRDILIWPPRTKAMFGISPDVPVTMQDFYDGLHPDDRENTAAVYAAAADPERRALYDVEYRTVGKEDGFVRWVAAKGRGVFDGSGRCVRVLGTAVDVTARRATEAALRESEADYRYAAELNPQVAWTAQPDGQLDRVADRWRLWTGLSGLGATWAESMHPEDLDRSLGAWAHSVASGEPYDIEHRARMVDGSHRWMHSRAYPRRDAEGRIVKWYGATEDIQVRREALDALLELNDTLEAHVENRTRDLEAAQEQLRQSQKMEAVGQLTGGIAHDFNNLLQGITGSLDLVRSRIAQGRTGELDRLINGAMTSASRAAALTHRLLAFSRRQPLDPKPVRANQLVASMEDLLRRTLGERAELELVLAGGLWVTLCDANQLENALLNLAINARDAMPDGGKLTVETCNAHLDSAYAAQQRNVSPGQYVCISVSDTGAGMPPEVVERAFDPFFTTKPMGQGTGLGLSMIYGFARQSEGYAKIYSEVGQGTTVKLYLPRHRGEAEAEAATPGLDDATAVHHGETVLVVEDEPVVRGLIVEALSELGYTVIEASDGPSGLRVVRSAARVDLLLTDIGLPGMNGRDLADAARAHRPGLRVLFMTGYAENAAVAGGFLQPGMAMITKPFALDQLRARVTEMVEG